MTRRALALAALVAAGCCVPPPPAEKFFELESPESTLKGFVYGIDAHQWDFAFSCLSRGTQEEVRGKLRFEGAIRFLSVSIPTPTGATDVAIEALITNALEYRTKAFDAGPRVAIMTTTLHARDDEGIPIGLDVRLYFVREGELWKLDLVRTMQELDRAASAAPADLTRR